MKRIQSIAEIKDQYSLIIGNFDGVHRGHESLLKSFVQLSKTQGLSSLLVTFWPHPVIVTSNKKKEFLLSFMEYRLTLFEAIGIDFVYILRFDENLRNLGANDFLDRILFTKNLKFIFTGHDFRLGKNKEGDEKFFNQYCAVRSINHFRSNPFYYDGQIVSSTLIRQCLSSHNLSKANDFLGRPLRIKGKVIRAKGLGQKIGVPTANLKVDAMYILPNLGVYFCQVYISGKTYQGLMNIGLNPTVDQDGVRKVEVHILHFHQEIYDQMIQVDILKWHRSEIKFQSIERLKEQLEQDIMGARSYFGT